MLEGSNKNKMAQDQIFKFSETREGANSSALFQTLLQCVVIQMRFNLQIPVDWSSQISVDNSSQTNTIIALMYSDITVCITVLITFILIA